MPPGDDLYQEHVLQTMAVAIRNRDRTLLFENYSKQAEAVLLALTEAGYAVVPARCDPEMVQAGKDALKMGLHRSHSVVERVYGAMVSKGAVTLRRC